MKTGIYKIENTVTGKCYIGSALYFAARWSTHRHHLHQGRHHSRYLQRAWNKYGPDAFVFSKLIVCKREDLLFYEQLCLDAYKPAYNICRIAGSALGMKLSDEQKARVRRSALRRVAKNPEFHAEITQKANAAMRVLWTDPTYRARRERVTKEVIVPKLSKYVTFNGETKTVNEWAQQLGINRGTLKTRLERWSVEEALTTPGHGKSAAAWKHRTIRNGKALFTYRGEQLTITELATALGTSHQAIRYYLRMHTIDEAINHYEAKRG